VRRLRDGSIAADAVSEWRPGGQWTCTYCDSAADLPWLRLALDGLVQHRLAVLTAEREQSDEHLRSLNRRLRAAWLAGAEAEWQRAEGRGLDEDELAFVIGQYPGDVTTTG
jgi:hypothetical protein